MSLVKNLLTQWETEEKHRTRDQSMKNLPTDERDRKENQKIISIDIVDEKTFQPGLRTGKEKSRVVERGETWFGRWETWMIRDLVRIRCCVVLQKSNCQRLNCHCRLPNALCARGDRFPVSRRLLALRTTLTRIPPCHLFLVASSLSPLPYCLFLVASSV